LEDAVERFIDYRGKTPKKSTSGVPLITAKIIKGGRIMPPDEFIPHEDYTEWMRRGLPQVGDVLFTTEAPLGEVAQIEDANVALAQRVLLLRGKTNLIDNTYLMSVFKIPFVWHQIETRTTGSTARGIRQKELRKIVIPVPPLTLQREFAARVTEVRELETAQTQSRARLNALFASLLSKAFKGEL
jgi:type I restriction enzyme S subunit